MASVDSAIEKALGGERISRQEALLLFTSSEFQRIALAADQVRRRLHPEGVVSFLIDRNINYTNVCVARCTFCNFYRRPTDREGYLLPKDIIFKKIEETLALGGTGILLQGGMNPELKIDYYEDLLRSIKSKYKIHLHCFSPPEIVVLAKLSKVTVREAIKRLSQAGLASIPGGGAEILTDRMRKGISPGKCTAEEWLTVMRTAHEEGLKTSATMMFGAGETDQELVDAKAPTCTAQEFDCYIWPKDVDGKSKKEAPVKENDHGMDSMRYATMSVDGTNRGRSFRNLPAGF